MSWRDDLQRVTMPDGRKLIGASFRGVPFFVEEATRTFGRRAEVHEFPQRNTPYVDDTFGRSVRRFSVEGYVLGDDYHRQADALVDAAEADGPGELVHPYFGIMRAVCAVGSDQRSKMDGGQAKFSLEFVEAPPDLPAPTSTPDLPGQVSAAADSALTAAQAGFEASYSVDGMPSFALASAEAAIDLMAQNVSGLMGPVIASTQELALIKHRLQIISAKASSLVRQPGDILSSFQDAFGALAETVVEFPGPVLDALLDAYEADLGPAPLATTATRVREAANHAALTAALRNVLVIEAARLAPKVAFDSVEQAMEARDKLAELLEDQAAVATDDAFGALIQLRAELVRAVPGDEELARILELEQQVAVPALLVSYQLYGSVEKEADIIARNGVRHPGFVSGTLKVLSDA